MPKLTNSHLLNYIHMSTKDRKLREKEERTEAIINIAEQLFEEKGYEKMTIDDIAKSLELAKGTIYLHFQSKEEVFGGIIRRGMQVMLNQLQKELLTNTTGLEQFTTLATTFKKFCQKHSIYMKSFALYQSYQFQSFIKANGPIVKEIEEEKSRIITTLTKIIQKGIEDKSINADIDSTKTAALTVLTVGSLINPPHRKSAELPSEDYIDYFIELMTKALRAG